MRAAFDASGEVLVVTGGAQGIGAAVAAAFAAAGGHSVVLDLIEPVAPAAGVEHRLVDVSHRGGVLEAIERVIADRGRVDGLVAGAAIQPRSALADMPEEDWLRTVDVNLNGVVWACQGVLPAMTKARRGSIIVFASGLARSGQAHAAAYAATKGAVVPLVKSLAAEVAPSRVRVNALFPGVIDTAQFRAANPDGPLRAHWRDVTGIGTPGDVVGPLMYLLSDAATMTGSILTRDRATSQEDTK
jgi:3-oxoacyl-[acyl-carrier protein] reductase